MTKKRVYVSLCLGIKTIYILLEKETWPMGAVSESAT